MSCTIVQMSTVLAFIVPLALYKHCTLALTLQSNICTLDDNLSQLLFFCLLLGDLSSATHLYVKSCIEPDSSHSTKRKTEKVPIPSPLGSDKVSLPRGTVIPQMTFQEPLQYLNIGTVHSSQAIRVSVCCNYGQWLTGSKELAFTSIPLSIAIRNLMPQWYPLQLRDALAKSDANNHLVKPGRVYGMTGSGVVANTTYKYHIRNNLASGSLSECVDASTSDEELSCSEMSDGTESFSGRSRKLSSGLSSSSHSGQLGNSLSSWLSADSALVIANPRPHRKALTRKQGGETRKRGSSSSSCSSAQDLQSPKGEAIDHNLYQSGCEVLLANELTKEAPAIEHSEQTTRNAITITRYQPAEEKKTESSSNAYPCPSVPAATNARLFQVHDHALSPNKDNLVRLATQPGAHFQPEGAPASSHTAQRVDRPAHSMLSGVALSVATGQQHMRLAPQDYHHSQMMRQPVEQSTLSMPHAQAVKSDASVHQPSRVDMFRVDNKQTDSPRSPLSARETRGAARSPTSTKSNWSNLTGFQKSGVSTTLSALGKTAGQMLRSVVNESAVQMTSQSPMEEDTPMSTLDKPSHNPWLSEQRVVTSTPTSPSNQANLFERHSQRGPAQGSTLSSHLADTPPGAGLTSAGQFEAFSHAVSRRQASSNPFVVNMEPLVSQNASHNKLTGTLKPVRSEQARPQLMLPGAMSFDCDN